MRAITTSTQIDARPQDVFAFLADGEKLPVWAIGFAKAIEPDGEQWIATLASGDRMPLRIDADEELGVVDFVSLPTPGVEAPGFTRVVPHGDGAVYTFTMLQTPDVPDEIFDAQAAELERELTVLKAHLESACPL
jgi:hypothetical protein